MDKKTSKLGLFFVGHHLSLALTFLLLSGCAGLNTGWNGNSTPYYGSYSPSDFDELLGFGANMAKMPPSSRTKMCRTLLKRQNNSSDPGIALHLMLGRLLSDACGDIPGILDRVATIPPEKLHDERLQRLVSINTEALKRMNNLSKKAGSMDHKPIKGQSVPESKDLSGPDKNETRLLKEKLEAIRSMEKHLDESGGAN